MMSVLPPGAKGTTKRIGLIGKFWDCATLKDAVVASNAALKNLRILKGMDFIKLLS
jgi:hypothetical protein